MATESGKRNRLEGDEMQAYPVCWCWYGRPTPFWVSVFGGYLVLVGGIWLLTRLELLPPLVQETVGPIAVILIGIAYLINSLSIRE